MSQANRQQDSKKFERLSFKFGNFTARYAWVSQRGYYPEDLNKANQDAHGEHENFLKDYKTPVDDCHVFAVFDGHGQTGDLCAHFIRDNWPDLMRKECFKQLDKGIAPSEMDVKVAYTNSLVEVNNNLHDDPHVDDSLSGTTCIAVFFLGGTVHVANLGDSRACLAQDRGDGKLQALALSQDQTPFRRDERERCKVAGAVVATMDQLEGLEEMHEDWDEGGDMDDDPDAGGDPPRIWWEGEMMPGCAFTRSVGDEFGERVGVFAEPEVLTRQLCSDDRMVLIASDGVWEFLTNQTVVNMMTQFKSPLKACRAVVNEAYKLWLQYDVRTDDITMIAIYLEDMANVDAEHAAQQQTKNQDMKRRSSVSQVKAANIKGAEMMRKKSLANRKMSMGVGLGALQVEDDLEQEVESKPVRRIMTKEKRKLMTDSVDTGQSKPESGFNYKVIGKVKPVEVKEIESAVKGNFLLSHLNTEQRGEVFSSMEACDVAVGNDVILAGEPGDWFYVVCSGVYDVLVGGSVVHTYLLEEGDEQKSSFGELALLYGTNKRAATVRCTEAGRVWRLNKSAFTTTVQRQDATKLMRTLRSVEALKALSRRQLLQLQDSLSIVKFKVNDCVIRQGEEGKEFYVIEEGDAVVTVNEPLAPGGQKEVMQLHPGDYFGERALLNEVADSRRAATVKALTPMKLLQISKSEFEDQLGSLDVIIDNHRKEREKAARHAYEQRQAEKLLDVTQGDFDPMVQVCKMYEDTSTLYLVRRYDEEKEAGKKEASKKEQRFTLRVYEKKKIVDLNVKKLVMGEVALFGSLPQCPFIPALLATFSDKRKLYAVFGELTAMELRTALGERVLHKEGKEGEKIAQFVIASVLNAVMHLHKHEIICRMCYRDTIVLNWNGYPMIADLTLSKALREAGALETFTLCGDPMYHSPEQITKGGYAYEADFWAVGVLAYELVTGTTPWPHMVALKQGKSSASDIPTPSPVEIYDAITSYKPKVGNEKSMNYPQSLSKELIDLMDDLIDPDKKSRLGVRNGGIGAGDKGDNMDIDDIESHGFFEEFDWSALEDQSASSPFKKECKDCAANAYSGQPCEWESAADYKGDNKWCDEWDFTCTVGYQVEDSRGGRKK